MKTLIAIVAINALAIWLEILICKRRLALKGDELLESAIEREVFKKTCASAWEDHICEKSAGHNGNHECDCGAATSGEAKEGDTN
jgi:hypothetical protein